MKDDLAFAALTFAVLAAVLGVLALLVMDVGAGSASAEMHARSLGSVGEPQIRQIEPVTVIGYRDPPEQRPNNLAIAPAGDASRKTQSATHTHDH